MENELIERLALARLRRDRAKKEMDGYMERVREQPDFLDLEKNLIIANQDLQNADVNFRAAAMSDFVQTKEKHEPSYDVTEETTLEVKDPQRAFQWCLKNMTPALSLNEKMFLTAAKSGSIPAGLFVATSGYKVKIHSDLSGFLPDLSPLD